MFTYVCYSTYIVIFSRTNNSMALTHTGLYWVWVLYTVYSLNHLTVQQKAAGRFRKGHESSLTCQAGKHVDTVQGRCTLSEWVLSKFNGTSTPKGSYRAKTGDNDCKVNSSHYSLSTALCESIRYQAKSEQNVRQDLIPRVGHGEAAVSTPRCTLNLRSQLSSSAVMSGQPWGQAEHCLRIFSYFATTRVSICSRNPVCFFVAFAVAS